MSWIDDNYIEPTEEAKQAYMEERKKEKMNQQTNKTTSENNKRSLEEIKHWEDYEVQNSNGSWTTVWKLIQKEREQYLEKLRWLVLTCAGMESIPIEIYNNIRNCFDNFDVIYEATSEQFKKEQGDR